MNIFGLAIPQIQASLAHSGKPGRADRRLFPPGRRLVALLIAASADLVGRRRLLLVTIFGQAIFTLLTAFATGYDAVRLARSSSPASSAMPRRCCALW